MLSTVPLVEMIKDEKRTTGLVTKLLNPSKIQSYADDTTIIIKQPSELKYVSKIYNDHAKASEAAINEDKTQNI